jgi:hypothetical protein
MVERHGERKRQEWGRFQDEEAELRLRKHLLICLRSRRAAGCLGASGEGSVVSSRGEACEVRGKERYGTDCADGPSGLDPMRLSPEESGNKAVGRCGRDVSQDKERCGVALWVSMALSLSGWAPGRHLEGGQQNRR